jgi:hypothetical protein
VSADPERKMSRQTLTEAENRNAGRSRVRGRMNEDEEGRGGVGNKIGAEKRPTDLARAPRVYWFANVSVPATSLSYEEM